jgi:hypothetical protein
MGIYDGFVVDNTTNDSLGSFFQITKEEDFIQKVVVSEIKAVETQFGKVVEVHIAQGEKTTKGWYANEPKEDYEFNGKTITAKMQLDTFKAKIAQLGKALQGDTFELKPTKNNFEGIVEGLNKTLKAELGKKEIYARLTLSGIYANLASKDGRVFSSEKDLLSVSEKDKKALKELGNQSSIKPDTEKKADKADDDDLPF